VTELEPPPPEPRAARRRRSAARTPALIDPVAIPEDAAGRVELIAVRAPADVLDPAEPPPPPIGESRLAPAVLTANGWVAVAVLAVLLVIVFVIGVVFTR
jgi:hypothetical protein